MAAGGHQGYAALGGLYTQARPMVPHLYGNVADQAQLIPVSYAHKLLNSILTCIVLQTEVNCFSISESGQRRNHLIFVIYKFSNLIEIADSLVAHNFFLDKRILR